MRQTEKKSKQLSTRQSQREDIVDLVMTRMTKCVKLEQRKDSFSVCCRPLFIYLCPFEAKRLSSDCIFTVAS